MSEGISLHSLDDLQFVVLEVCEACFVSDVQESIYLCTSNRFDTVLGKALYGRAGNIRRRIGKKSACGIEEADDEYILAIVINNRLFWHINDIGKAEIIAHETCHIIDFYLQLMETGKIIATHNDRWKRMMWACGFDAREYIPHKDLGISEHYVLSCDCGYRVNTSIAKHNRVRRGTLDVGCRSCNQKLRATDLIENKLDKRESA